MRMKIWLDVRTRINSGRVRDTASCNEEDYDSLLNTKRHDGIRLLEAITEPQPQARKTTFEKAKGGTGSKELDNKMIYSQFGSY